VREFRRLPRFERRLLVGAWAALFFVRLGLLLLPFRAMHALQKCIARRAARRGKTPPADIDEKVAWAIDAATRRHPGQATCLRRAMAAAMLLNLCGARADLRIGVTRDDRNEFAAHAWIEREGKVIVGNLHNLQDYSTFPPL